MESFTVKQWVIVTLLVAAIAFGAGILVGRSVAIENTLSEQPSITESEVNEIMYSVYITGAVKNPDVYEVPEGAIVRDLIIKAGGVLDDADLINCNLAYRVHDGEKIVIPFKASQSSDSTTLISGTASSVSTTVTEGKVNINSSTVEQLMKLPGIGEVKAKAIIEYRETNGYFKSIEEIMNVSGIGEKTFEKIRDLITVY